MKRVNVVIECKCGCGKTLLKYDERGRERATIYGHKEKKHGMWGTSTYNSWSCMLSRCTNPKEKAYKNYGARGIQVCKEWLKFENFFADMGVKPKGLTIERENNELGYFKENCCWATRTVQNRNKRLDGRNKTGASGVTWHKKTQKWRVNIDKKHIGLFVTIEAAIEAREQAEQKYWR